MLFDAFSVPVAVTIILRHLTYLLFFFLMIRRPPRSTLDRSSAASDVYKRQAATRAVGGRGGDAGARATWRDAHLPLGVLGGAELHGAIVGAALSLIHISEPTRPY